MPYSPYYYKGQQRSYLLGPTRLYHAPLARRRIVRDACMISAWRGGSSTSVIHSFSYPVFSSSPQTQEITNTAAVRPGPGPQPATRAGSAIVRMNVYSPSSLPCLAFFSPPQHSASFAYKDSSSRLFPMPPSPSLPTKQLLLRFQI